jgi:hypothetical protein
VTVILSPANHVTGIKLLQQHIIQAIIEVFTLGAQSRSPIDLARSVVTVVVAMRYFCYWSTHSRTRTIADPPLFPSFQSHRGSANARSRFTRNITSGTRLDRDHRQRGISSSGGCLGWVPSCPAIWQHCLRFPSRV